MDPVLLRPGLKLQVSAIDKCKNVKDSSPIYPTFGTKTYKLEKGFGQGKVELSTLHGFLIRAKWLYNSLPEGRVDLYLYILIYGSTP